MELSQRVRISVAQSLVWTSLNDPDLLKLCLPGCEVFRRCEDGSFEVEMTAKIGPVKAKFKGLLNLSDVNEPVSYTISGSGKGGVAGFAKGSANVRLEPLADDLTLMTYSVDATVGGKLAQIGSRLVMGAARKMANDFFSGFVRQVSGNANMDVVIETVDVNAVHEEPDEKPDDQPEAQKAEMNSNIILDDANSHQSDLVNTNLKT